MADDPNQKTDTVTLKSKFFVPTKYPYTDEDSARLSDYSFYHKLFDGDHFTAFRQQVKSEDFNKAYAKLRYIYINFAGMLSRIVGDMLFGEPIQIKVENKELQSWLEDLWDENFMDAVCLENALDNSAYGDMLLKLRVGKKSEKGENTVLIEHTPPTIYFPHIDGFNVSAEAEVRELAWIVKINAEKYLRREIHEPGTIYNELYKMKGNEVKERVNISLLGVKGMTDAQSTKIDRHMLLHIPNWKTGSRHFGYSDYYDLDAIFFAINNRISKIDNVLDLHTDPFLMVPEGVIGEDGKVKRDGRIIEMGEGENGKPEYIVWDASLENAFKQIDKLVEFFQMIGEVSPEINGQGKNGAAESGRALKFKLLRTLSKVNRKKLYYHRNVREALYVAQLLAKEHGATVRGQKMTWEPEMPELIWQDGLPADETELIDNAQKEIDAGTMSQKEAIMKIHQVDDDTAEKSLKEINKEKEAKMPTPLDPKRNPFNPKGQNNPPRSEPPTGGK